MTAKSIVVYAAAALFLSACGGGGGSDSDVIPSFVLPTVVRVADINQDGALDILVAGSTVAGPPPHPAFVATLTQNPTAPGTFSSSVRFPAEFDPSDMVVADLSGSDRQDIVLTSSRLKLDPLVPTNVVILRHDPSNRGRFLGPMLFSIGDHLISGVAVGDVNGDGRADIVVTAGPVSAGPTILIFTQSAERPGTYDLTQSISTARSVAFVTLADLDGDGRQDMVVTAGASVNPGIILVYMQDPANPGNFMAPTEYAVGQQPQRVAIGDLNGDGKPDLAVVNMGLPSGAEPSMAVLLQDPTALGRFRDAVKYPSSPGPEDIAISDIDGDGRPDIIATNGSGAPPFFGSAQIYFQTDVPGTFRPPVRVGSFSGATTLAVGDLNGDKAPDIVINDGEGISVLFQNALQRGQFLPVVHFGI